MEKEGRYARKAGGQWRPAEPDGHGSGDSAEASNAASRSETAPQGSRSARVADASDPAPADRFRPARRTVSGSVSDRDSSSIVALVVALVTAAVRRRSPRARATAERRDGAESVEQLAGALGRARRARRLARRRRGRRRTLDEVAALPGVDAVVLDALTTERRAAAHRARRLRRRGRARRAPDAAEHERPRDRGRLPLPARRRREGSGRLRAGLVVPLPAARPGRSARSPRSAARPRTASPTRRSTRSRARAARRARARQRAAASPRPGSSPSSTRSPASTTAAASTSSSRARSRAPGATSGGSRWSCFDLDDFKSINDRLGHLAGDVVLAEVAARVRRVVRATDIACRVGGDEFARDPARVEPRRRRAARRTHRAHGRASARSDRAGRSTSRPASPSCGREDDANLLFDRADVALYRAKDAGKDTARRAEQTAQRTEKTARPGCPGLARYLLFAYVSRRAASRPRGSPPVGAPRGSSPRHLFPTSTRVATRRCTLLRRAARVIGLEAFALDAAVSARHARHADPRAPTSTSARRGRGSGSDDVQRRARSASPGLPIGAPPASLSRRRAGRRTGFVETIARSCYAQ